MSILTSGPASTGSGSQKTGEGSDRRIEKKGLGAKKLLIGGGSLIAAIAVVMAFISVSGGKKYDVDRNRLTIETVERAPFTESIAVTGNVLPRRTVFLDAVEGGRIDEIYVIEGQQVEEGQPLLRLSNNTLELSLLNADAQRIEQINRLQDTRFRMQQEALTRRQQLAEMEYQILRLERLLDRNRSLHEKQLISQQEFDSIRDEYQYWADNKRLTLDAYRADSMRMTADIQRMQMTVERMESNFKILERILDNLVVRAPVSGQLTALDAELGELRPAGSRFGQIDELSGYRVRAGVDEFYISRVARDQSAFTQPIAGQTYELQVKRVYPEVQNGRFEIDLDFVGDVPPSIRRGQTVRFNLEMSEQDEALVVPKGGFFQTTGGSWVFVEDGSSGRAVKSDVRFGRQNPQYYEVLSGLEPGDRVITSSYDNFADVDQLVLN
jgi:HlyD family secretion protein